MQQLSTLTPREIEVLYLLASGYSSKQIADKLGMSKRTAEKHIENILKKLRAPNAPAAVSISILAKIIQPHKINPLRTPPQAR